MKKVLILLLIALFSFSAFARCKTREAQFSGTITNIYFHAPTEFRGAYTSFQIRIGGWFSSHALCPMWEDEFESAVIEIEGIPLIGEGDMISGVLVYDKATKTYWID